MNLGNISELIQEIELQRNNYMNRNPKSYPDNVMLHPDWKPYVDDYFSHMMKFEIEKVRFFGIRVIWTTQIPVSAIQLTINCN